MATKNPSDLVDSGGAIPNQQLASVMRRSMENKNLLAKKGSIYVGTGTDQSTTVGSDTFKTAITEALEAPAENGRVLISDTTATLGIRWGGSLLNTAQFETFAEIGGDWGVSPAGSPGRYFCIINPSNQPIAVSVEMVILEEGGSVEKHIPVYCDTIIERNEYGPWVITLFSDYNFQGNAYVITNGQSN